MDTISKKKHEKYFSTHTTHLCACTRDDKTSDKKIMQSVCSICAETAPLNDFVKVSCCQQKLCQSCVDRIIETKATQASEFLCMYLSPTIANRAHQCPQCHTGPIEHFACSDLTESSHNRCPKCEFSSQSIKSWPLWNGELCESLQAYDSDRKQIDCPFCRQQCSLSSMLQEPVGTIRRKLASQSALVIKLKQDCAKSMIVLSQLLPFLNQEYP